MAKKIDIQVKARGAKKAGQELGKVDSRLKGLAKSAGLAAAGFFGGRALLSGMKEAIRLAGIQEQAEKKLAVALGGTSTALLKQASALQQVTTFGDEAILGVQASLAAFIKNEDQIKKATVATLDMAVAMGMDLKAAGDLVAKTLGSSTNAMSRYGIEVNGAVGSTERLESLTNNVAKLFGGQAKAQAETLAGSIEQMKNAIGDTAEALGRLLAPAITNIAVSMKAAAEKVGSFFQEMTETSLETSIRELQSLGVNTLNLELAFAKAESAKVKYLAVGLREEEEISANLENAANKRVELMGQLANQQANLLVDSSSEEQLRQEILNAQITLGLRTAETGAQVKKEARETIANNEAKLATIESLNNQIQIQAEIIEQDQNDLEITQKAEASKSHVLALEKAILESKKEGVELEDTEDSGTPDLSDFDIYVEKQQKIVDLKAKEADLVSQLIEKERSLAESLGLVVNAEEAAKKAKEEKLKLLQDELRQAALVQGSAQDAMKAVVRAESMEAVSGLIASILKDVPFPFNLVLAAGAGATASKLIDKGLSSFAQGGDFVTSGPQMMMVGDNPGGRERVQVTPLSSPNQNGPQQGLTVNISGGVVQDDYVRNELIPALNKATGTGASLNA
jgi:hypothetical protein